MHPLPKTHIDNIRHQNLGTFAGYPVYQPLETVPSLRGMYNFGCHPGNLVIGGGSGEHPGLVVHNRVILMAHYLLERMDMDSALDS